MGRCPAAARHGARPHDTQQDLQPWHAVRGVYLVDKDAFSLDAKTALGLYTTGPWLFIAYSATFAVAHDHGAGSLLFT